MLRMDLKLSLEILLGRKLNLMRKNSFLNTYQIIGD
ncbi:hypothetical protein Q7M_1241 (plasmid) [Borrelia crocidurae str. Achema]|uniref:Uncharacterized protein n=1 Tax=Borrelia crocidurae (strain Achema) TaxID=1155096 RepID=I0FEU2_BORCA|nr:hypothetical protein Q7M_1241 [Borrelia crocidurae str. Achema]